MPTPPERVFPDVARIHFRGEELKLTTGDPEKVWVADGTLHMRGVPFENRFVGTCGEEESSFLTPIVANLAVDEGSGDGWIWGTYQYIADGDQYRWGDRVGTFNLIFWGQIESGTASAEIVGLGSGDFDGMLMLGSLTSPENASAPVEAIILDFGAGS